MVLPPAETIRRRRRRHRYLRIDKETQMSKEQLRHNMQTGHTTCRAFVSGQSELRFTKKDDT